MHHAFGASIATMLLVAFLSAPAAAQSGAETTASETWKTAAASAAASTSTAGSGAGASIAEAPVASPPRTAVAPSADSATAAGTSNIVATPLDMDSAQPGIAEIPPANPADASQQQPSPADSQASYQSNEVLRYQEEQSGLPPEQLRSLQEFDSEGELSTPFGMQLREAKRTLSSGEEADGLLITVVAKGSPAEAVGLHAYSHSVHDALTGVVVVSSMVPFGQFAILLLPVLDYAQVGESYDMIIGVDGSRVTNFLDFQDRMRDLQPGELIYLSVVRNGKRLQVTMPVPANVLQATN
jgi:hypothetical protein